MKKASTLLAASLFISAHPVLGGPLSVNESEMVGAALATGSAGALPLTHGFNDRTSTPSETSTSIRPGKLPDQPGASSASADPPKNESMAVSPADAGAHPNGADVTTLLQSSLINLTAGGVFSLNRGGAYLTGPLTISKSIRITSDGSAENNAQFQAKGENGAVLNVRSAPGFWLSNVSFVTAKTRRTLDPYIDLQKVYRSSLRDFRMDGHSVGIRMNDCSNINIEPTSTFAFPLASTIFPGTTSLSIGETAYCGKVTIRGAYFTSQQVPDVYDDAYQPESGIALYNADNTIIDGTFMAYQGQAITARPTKGEATTYTYITNNTLDYGRRQVLLAPRGGVISHTIIRGNLMAYSHLEGGIAADASQGEVSDTLIEGNQLINHTAGFLPGSRKSNPLNNAIGTAVRTFGPVQGLRILNNAMSNNNVAINIGDGATSVVIAGNDFGSNGSFAPASATAITIGLNVHGRAYDNRFNGVATPLVNNSPATFLTDEWQDFTSIITAGVGSGGVATGVGRFRTIGNRVEYVLNIKETANGSWNQDLRFSFPPPIAILGTATGTGRSAGTGKQVQLQDLSPTQGIIWGYDNSYPGGPGTIRIAGEYEVAAP